jgi:hypothetical protein
LPDPLAIHIGQGVPLAEPFWFFLGFGRRPGSLRSPQPLEHAPGLQYVTGVRLTGPGLGWPSEAAQAVVAAGAVTLQEAPDHLGEITFDSGARGELADLRPMLPLVLRW